jgi:hypothetical protein
MTATLVIATTMTATEPVIKTPMIKTTMTATEPL